MMDALTVKLASLAVHAEELLEEEARGHAGARAAEFDRESIRGLLRDPEVREWLDDPAHAVLLPVKRSAAGEEG
jgi:hypothetical protein